MNEMVTQEKFGTALEEEIKKMESAKGCNLVTSYGDPLDTLRLMIETGSPGLHFGRAQRYYVREREGSVTKTA